MIHALLTMPLAMPLEKMAKGDEGAKAQAMFQYLADRGCAPGIPKFTIGLNSFGGATYTETKSSSLPLFMKEKDLSDGTKVFMSFLTGDLATADADTVFRYTYLGANDEPIAWGEELEQSFGGRYLDYFVSCPVEYTASSDDIAVAVHGDPMFQHDGKGQHFWLKEGVLSPLLDWTSDDGHKMSLQGLTVANAETGHQWFKQIALVRDGKQVFDAKAGFSTKPVLAMSGNDDGLDGLLGLAPGNTTAVVDASTKFVGPKANQKAVQVIKAGGMTFELSAESAHKFADAAQQSKYAHVNVKMPNGLVPSATGLFAELAGAQPMSGATKALLRSPK